MTATQPGALHGIRVLELGEFVSAAYCAKLLADLGAEVIKAESPNGDPARQRGPFPQDRPDAERSGLFLYLNASKRGITLDYTTPEGRDLLSRLAGSVDLVVHNFAPNKADAAELTYAGLRGANPAVVVTSITPFGRTGPHRDYAAVDLNVVNAGGWAYLSPGESPDASLPPLKAFGHHSDFHAGATAAMASLGALLGMGPGDEGTDVDVSAQECIAGALDRAIVHYLYAGTVPTRYGSSEFGPFIPLPCREGAIFIHTPYEDNWRAFVKMMGEPEWSTWEVFQDCFSRRANWDVLLPLILEWLARHSAQDVMRMATEAHLPFGILSTTGDLLASEHLEAREFFTSVVHPLAGALQFPGAPYRLNATPWAVSRPAPRLGEHNTEVYGELAGLTSADLTALRERHVI